MLLRGANPEALHYLPVNYWFGSLKSKQDIVLVLTLYPKILPIQHMPDIWTEITTVCIFPGLVSGFCLFSITIP